jgi:hypothetical protein
MEGIHLASAQARRLRKSRYVRLCIVSATVAGLAVACEQQGPADDSPSTSGTAGSGGSSPAGAGGATGGTGGTGVQGGGTGGVGGSAVAGFVGLGGAAGSALGGGAPAAGAGPITAGSAGTLASAGSGGEVAAAGSGGAAPGSGGEAHVRDHCVEGFEPDPADASMVDGPAEYVENGQIDLTVQPAVLEWMTAHEWQAAHFEWHSIRRCNGGMSQSRVDICSHTEMIPADQECKTDGDGMQFLAMHRHMIQSLRQLFPNHTEQFEGFDRFPQSAEEVPQQWRSDWSAFSASELANAKIADEIDKPENLSRFASEGAFGRWLQCLAPSYSGLHGALHFKWVRTMNSTHGVGNQFANIDNYMFWKLHGWIDKVWEKYRVAKGLSPDDPALKDAIVKQCREMDALAQIVNPELIPDACQGPPPPETGFFHTNVRPIFESNALKCSGCHTPPAPEAGMALGGSCISSAQIVNNLVNQPSAHGGQFLRVKPGDPDNSWLYLKAAGMASGSGCVASATASCNPQAMPPSSEVDARPTAEQLATLRQWILDGAPAPTSP